MTSVATPSSGPATPSGNLRARVLVVDDSSTILRVVSRILQRHGYEVACARDGVEGMQQLQVAGPFDLVLLDFVMPRKNGYQFVRELRATEHHRDMPVVLMSARTTAIGDRFVEQTGAVDALSKPFDARALVAVVGGVIAKRAEQVQQGAPAPVLPLPEAMVDEDQLDEKAPESEMHRPSQLGRLDPMTRLIVDAVVPPLRALSPSEFAVPGRIEEAVQRGLQATTAELVEAAAEVCHTVESDEILSGRLSKIPLAEVMQLFQLRRQTGVMEVRHKGRSMTLSIRQGMLDLAQSNELDREFRLGRYLVRNCGITREELPDLIAQVDNEQQLGEWLIQHKRISEEELYRALAHQTCELVYEVLRWPQGSFRLRDIPFSEEAERARLELGLGELALEGFRRVDEWRLMADTV
ncbi:MAG TPA: response regulator, partial [Sorangium sp.]|nr:response regulator [Sorangium sp.]